MVCVRARQLWPFFSRQNRRCKHASSFDIALMDQEIGADTREMAPQRSVFDRRAKYLHSLTHHRTYIEEVTKRLCRAFEQVIGSCINGMEPSGADFRIVLSQAFERGAALSYRRALHHGADSFKIVFRMSEPNMFLFASTHRCPALARKLANHRMHREAALACANEQALTLQIRESFQIDLCDLRRRGDIERLDKDRDAPARFVVLALRSAKSHRTPRASSDADR